MDVYFDKDNLKAYINKVMGYNGREISREFRDVDNMLQEQCDILLSFSEKELKDYCSREQIDKISDKFEIDKREKMGHWMRLMSDGSHGHSIKYETDFPLKSPGFCSDDDSMLTMDDEHYRWYTSVVFQSKKKYERSKIDQLGLLSSIPTFEIETLQKIFINEKYIPSKIYYLRGEEGRSSMKEGYCGLPCTDIIISDPYVFSKKDDYPYEKNIYAIIDSLCNESKNAKIVFYTEYFQEFPSRIPPKFDVIKEYINTRYNADVTFIKPHIKELEKWDSTIKDEQHDRYIITNYRMITSGSSFTYFDNNGNYSSKGLWATVCSLCDRDNYLVFLNAIRDIQNVINKCSIKDRSKTDTTKSIYGDMESNFLNFNKL